MTGRQASAGLVWGLGATQIIGYGTLYYSFAILAPDMARDLSLPLDWLFGLLSVALVCGGLIAPTAGRWADRFGAGRLMAAGSGAAGLALLAAAFAPTAPALAAALVAMEVASAFVLYGTAFAAIVQAGSGDAQRRITHLTLVGGFASTLFWPLAATLLEHMSWRLVYAIFALLHIAVCLPIHAWIARLCREPEANGASDLAMSPPAPAAVPAARRTSGLFLLMLAAFAAEGLVLAAILVHMVPMMNAMGLAAAGLAVSMLFGPSQVASRLVNMVAGGRLAQTTLAVIAAVLLPIALLVLFGTSPWLPGVVVFAVLFGFGSGLASIVGGTLPLELFGRAGYGARLGWVTAARQFSSAFAPFAFAFALERWGVQAALSTGIALGAVGAGLFIVIAVLRSGRLARRTGHAIGA